MDNNKEDVIGKKKALTTPKLNGFRHFWSNLMSFSQKKNPRAAIDDTQLCWKCKKIQEKRFEGVVSIKVKYIHKLTKAYDKGIHYYKEIIKIIFSNYFNMNLPTY